MFKTLLASQCVVVIIVILLEAVATVDVITACMTILSRPHVLIE